MLVTAFAVFVGAGGERHDNRAPDSLPRINPQLSTGFRCRYDGLETLLQRILAARILAKNNLIRAVLPMSRYKRMLRKVREYHVGGHALTGKPGRRT
ncbi:MAG: hypothetical protein JO236_15035 [Mycobacterium sp.]|uniref:hypothetical protein n=1 Tax=Mycobacterium sp. TaxID=1785 RepID=UPI001EB55975|nr:hypothetical protein [Mycobacterium sp.]MBW0018844.1 hypothetical protein [Mycobacterium sp.]